MCPRVPGRPFASFKHNNRCLAYKEIRFDFPMIDTLIDTSDLVLQVTVMHSMQAGYLEKAQKYTDKALMQLEKLKSERRISLFLLYYFPCIN